MRKLLICALLFHTFLLQSQPPPVNPNSATNKRSQAASKPADLANLSGKEKFRELLRLANSSKDSEEAEKYASEALRFSLSLNDTSMQSQAWDIMGRSFHRQGRYILASDCFRKGLELVAGHPKYLRLESHLNNSLGIIHSKRGEYNEALPHFLGAKDYFIATGAQQQLSSVLTNLGALYIQLHDYDNAILVSQQSLEIAEMMDDKGIPFMGQALNNLGSAYEELEMYDRALECYRRSLVLKQQHSQPVQKIATLASIFSVHAKKREDLAANEYFQEAFSLAETTDSKYWLQRLYVLYGEFLQDKGQPAEALDYYQKSLTLAKYLTTRSNEMELHQKIADTYASLDLYKDALFHQQRFQQLNDSIFNQKRISQLGEIKAKYELDERLHEMSLQVAYWKNEENIARLHTYGLMAIAILIITALIALFSRYRIRQRSHQVLEAKNREIESKNSLLESQSRDIQSQNQLLETINRDLEQFAYAASHDLRQPLRTVISYLELLERRYEGQLAPDAREFIQYAASGAGRMEQLLRDLLDYSRIGRNPDQFEPVSLDDTLEEVQAQLTQQIQENGATLLLPSLPYVQARRSEMVQLFQNLISNAIKFQHPDRTPEIVVRSWMDGNDTLISVQDNGIGIAEKDQEKVFGMFERINKKEDYEGSGIGLAICKKIMEQHNGQISLTSSPGTGTTFTLRFPHG
jgi:signal transduction histidine kinase